MCSLELIQVQVAPKCIFLSKKWSGSGLFHTFPLYYQSISPLLNQFYKMAMVWSSAVISTRNSLILAWEFVQIWLLLNHQQHSSAWISFVLLIINSASLAHPFETKQNFITPTTLAYHLVVVPKSNYFQKLARIFVILFYTDTFEVFGSGWP